MQQSNGMPRYVMIFSSPASRSYWPWDHCHSALLNKYLWLMEQHSSPVPGGVVWIWRWWTIIHPFCSTPHQFEFESKSHPSMAAISWYALLNWNSTVVSHIYSGLGGICVGLEICTYSFTQTPIAPCVSTILSWVHPTSEIMRKVDTEGMHIRAPNIRFLH